MLSWSDHAFLLGVHNLPRLESMIFSDRLPHDPPAVRLPHVRLALLPPAADAAADVSAVSFPSRTGESHDLSKLRPLHHILLIVLYDVLILSVLVPFYLQVHSL